MNVEKFMDRLRDMKVSEAKAVADRIKALPDKSRSMACLKLISILALATEGTGEIRVETKTEPEPLPKAASAIPRDTDDVRFC